MSLSKKILFPLENGRYYRYLSPGADTNDLSLFYGPKRSFSQGFIFDDSDIIIEFVLIDRTGIREIGHHIGSYLGPLTPENSIITRMFIRKPDELMYLSRDQFREAVTNLISQLPDEVTYFMGHFPNIYTFSGRELLL